MNAAAEAFALTSLPRIDQADVARWDGVEPPELRFAIAGLAPEGMTTLLVGHGGAGKSILMQMALACTPSGLPFLGKATAGGNAAGIFAEDPEAVLHLRQTRINEALGVDMEPLSGRLFIRSYSGLDATLWRDGAPTEFMHDIETQFGRIPELRLVVLDNVALLYAGNENDRLEVTAFVNALNGLADRLRIGLVLSTHASKSQDGSSLRVASGSTAWVNACRSVLELKPAEGDEPPTLTVVKANHAEKGDPIELEWEGSVLRAAGGASGDSGVFGTIKRRSNETIFLEALDKLSGQGRRVNATTNQPTYAPRVMLQMPSCKGHRRRELERAMNSLFDAGEIRIKTEGKGHHQRSYLVRASEPEEG